MGNLFEDIIAFHKKFGLEYNGEPRVLDDELADYRAAFMREEWQEYIDGRVVDDLEEMLDALVDLVYVALGTAYLHGFDFNQAWERVHAANMAKVRATAAEQSKRGTAYDVVKPEGWVPPDLSDLVS